MNRIEQTSKHSQENPIDQTHQFKWVNPFDNVLKIWILVQKLPIKVSQLLFKVRRNHWQQHQTTRKLSKTFYLSKQIPISLLRDWSGTISQDLSRPIRCGGLTAIIIYRIATKQFPLRKALNTRKLYRKPPKLHRKEALVMNVRTISSENQQLQFNQPSPAGNRSTSRPKADPTKRSTSSQRTLPRNSSAQKVQVPLVIKERQTSRNRVNLPKPKPSLAPSPKVTTKVAQTFPEPKSTTTIKIAVKARCNFSTKSWVAYHYKRLLEHERGHYLIGCLCALEFKRLAEAKEWEVGEATPTLQEQAKTLFQQNFRLFGQLERAYDNETAHFDEQEVQLLWNQKIKEQLILYKHLFNPQ